MRKFTAEHVSDVEQRVAAAHHANIVWTVADDISFRAVPGIFAEVQHSKPEFVPETLRHQNHSSQNLTEP